MMPPALSGTYVLVLKCRRSMRLPVGRLGVLRVERGYYTYVGSACGSGGLAARIRHHSRVASRPHWHIDYLRAQCEVVDCWFTSDTPPSEHAWAEAMMTMPGVGVPFARFGSSDCDCLAHLFWLAVPPSVQDFARCVEQQIFQTGKPITAWSGRAGDVTRGANAPGSEKEKARGIGPAR